MIFSILCDSIASPVCDVGEEGQLAGPEWRGSSHIRVATGSDVTVLGHVSGSDDVGSDVFVLFCTDDFLK